MFLEKHFIMTTVRTPHSYLVVVKLIQLKFNGISFRRLLSPIQEAFNLS